MLHLLFQVVTVNWSPLRRVPPGSILSQQFGEQFKYALTISKAPVGNFMSPPKQTID